MNFVLAVAGLALVAVPGLARPLGRRLAPSEWAKLTLLALALGAVSLELGLILLAAPTVLRALGVPELAAACERTVATLTPGGPLLGWTAALGALALLLLGRRAIMRSRRARRDVRVDSTLGRHEDHGDYELVVLPTPQPLAVSVPGRPPQVIVSEGLESVLTSEELAVVLGHERAHLLHRHDRYLVLGALVDAGLGWLPVLRRSTHELRVALERWADEEAATITSHGRARVREALLAVGHAMLDAPRAAAFSTPATLADRLDALEQPPRTASRLARSAAHAPVGAVAAIMVVGLGSWIGEAHMMVSMAGFCRF